MREDNYIYTYTYIHNPNHQHIYLIDVDAKYIQKLAPYYVISAYRRHDDDQELLSLELLHRAHFDVRQANFTQQHSNLLTLKDYMKHFRMKGCP